MMHQRPIEELKYEDELSLEEIQTMNCVSEEASD